MRKFTLFFALMVAMVTTAFAQSIDVSKQYYLRSSIWVGTSKVSAYMNLAPKYTIDKEQPNTSALLLETSQALTFEKVWEGTGTDPYYLISAMVVEGTSGEVKKYLGSGNWDATLEDAADKACRFEFVSAGTNGFYIRRANSDKYLKSDYLSADKGIYTVGVYTDGNATNAATWTLEEVAAEPAGLTVVSQTPAADVQVESLSSITIEFDKAVKLDWAPSAGTGTDATAGPATGTGTVDYIKLKARDESTAATAWFSQAVVDGNKITFNFEAAVKTTGTYTFTIPADLIIAKEGDEKYAGGTFTFKVLVIAAPTYTRCSFEPKPDWSNCYTLEHIKATFSENIEVVGTEALQLKNGEEVVATITDILANGKNLFLYLDEDKYITPEVTTEYSLVIPAGYVVTKGTDKGLANDATLTGTVKARFVVKNIEPATTETVEAFEKIVVEFNMAVNANTAKDLVLRNDANGNEIALTPSVEGNVLTLTPATAVANGTYTLRQSGLATGNGLEKIAATGGDAIYNAPAYTITVDAPLYDASEFGVTFNPDNGYSCESVKFSFAEVVEVVGAGPYAVVYNENDEVVTEITTYTQASLAAYRKNATFNLAEKITAAGTYTVKFNAAIIKGTESGKVYAGGEYEFTVTKRPVSITPVDAPRGDVEEIYPNYEILIQYADEVTVDTEKAVTMTVGENTYTATLTTEDGSWGYKISIVFDAEFAYGDYTFTIPAGLYTVNGTPNEKEVYEFTYAEPVLLKVVSITPAVGTVESFSAITIEFNTPVVCEYGFEFAGCYFMQDAYTWQPRQTVTFIATDMTSGELATISAPGEYVFDLTFAVEWGTKFADDQETKITWTIEGETTAIDAVDAEAENAVIYDLTGRRVEKITKAGIYVINGVKKVVK